MKKAVFLIVFCASTVMVFAKTNNLRRYPPNSVQRSWQRDYPNYNYNNNDEPWEWRNNRWHRRFRDRNNNDRNIDVYYDRSGRRLYSMSDWNRDDLPVRVRERIRARYRADNYNVYRIERPGRGFYFQITLGNNRRIYLDDRGREVRHYY